MAVHGAVYNLVSMINIGKEVISTGKMEDEKNMPCGKIYNGILEILICTSRSNQRVMHYMSVGVAHRPGAIMLNCFWMTCMCSYGDLAIIQGSFLWKAIKDSGTR